MSGPIDLSSLHVVVGHATDEEGATGLTVIRGVDQPMRAGVARFGRATGSRELPVASPDHLVDGRIDAILLAGGSAYGLDAAAGVMQWMEQRGRGFSVGGGVVPIVPVAVVFDLAPLGRFDARPTRDMAFAACDSASATVTEGSVGAGAGVTVGKVLGPDRSMKGGFGGAVVSSHDLGLTVGALAVVNAFGDVRDSAGAIIAGARSASGSFADTDHVIRTKAVAPAAFDALALRNTTLVVVMCSAPLSSAALSHLATAAGAGLYRRITPVATSFDGDLVFAVSPCDGPPSRVEPMIIESLATAAVEHAIERAVRLARGRDGIPGIADHHAR